MTIFETFTLPKQERKETETESIYQNYKKLPLKKR